MTIRRAMPVVVVADPAASREFYEDFLGFEAVMDEEGFLPMPLAELVFFADEGTDALAYLEESGR